MKVIDALRPYAKSVILFILIILAIVADLLGADIGLDVEHYIALLIGNGLVYAVPNTASASATEVK